MCWPARLPNYIYDYNSHIIPNNQCPDPKTCLGTLEVFHIFWWQGDDFKSPLRGALDGTHALSIVVCTRQISRCIEIFRSSTTRVYTHVHVYTSTDSGKYSNDQSSLSSDLAKRASIFARNRSNSNRPKDTCRARSSKSDRNRPNITLQWFFSPAKPVIFWFFPTTIRDFSSFWGGSLQTCKLNPCQICAKFLPGVQVRD